MTPTPIMPTLTVISFPFIQTGPRPALWQWGELRRPERVNGSFNSWR